MARKDGIKTNGLLKKVEPLISVQQLKDRWLHGVGEIKDLNGKPLKTEVYQNYINNAVSMLEHFLDISIVPETITEQKDYHANDYWDWGFLMLNNIPVIEITKWEVVYLEDESGQPDVVLDIPQSWWRFKEHDGLLRLVPNNRFPGTLQVDANGTFFPELFRRNNTVPHLWRITYTYGFKDGKIPMAVNMAIGLLSAIMALNIAGDLIIGAGIASESLSLDGLAQSIQTTSSAENHGYSAKVKEYQRILFGANKDDPMALLKLLKSYYQGETLNIV